MTSIITLHKISESLDVFTSKIQFLSFFFNVMCKIESNMSAPVLFSLINLLRKRDKVHGLLILIASLKCETMGKQINTIPWFVPFDIKFSRLSFENAC